MSRRKSEADEHLQYKNDTQNRMKYVPMDGLNNYQNPERMFHNMPANHVRKHTYEIPEPSLNNYDTYYVPIITDSDVTGNGKIKQPSGIHTRYSYSSNSFYPTYVNEPVHKDSDNVSEGRNKVKYLKYPKDEVVLKDSKYYSTSNYLLKEQEQFYEYDFMSSDPNYTYFVADNKTLYNNNNPTTNLPNMVYSSYVPEIDTKYNHANTTNYYPYNIDQSICSPSEYVKSSTDDLVECPLGNYYRKEEPDDTSNKAKKIKKRLTNMLKHKSRTNVPNQNDYESNVSPICNNINNETFCNEAPTKQNCTINVCTQTLDYMKENTCNKTHKNTTFLASDYTQTESEDSNQNRSKETQTTGLISDFFNNNILNTLSKKEFITWNIKTIAIRWVKRILIEMVWSIYNCPLHDQILFSYLDMQKRKSKQIPSSVNHEREIQKNVSRNFYCPCSPSRRNCRKQRIKN